MAEKNQATVVGVYIIVSKCLHFLARPDKNAAKTGSAAFPNFSVSVALKLRGSVDTRCIRSRIFVMLCATVTVMVVLIHLLRFIPSLGLKTLKGIEFGLDAGAHEDKDEYQVNKITICQYVFHETYLCFK